MDGHAPPGVSTPLLENASRWRRICFVETPSTKSLTFSSEEREYILNSDLAVTEVGLTLVERAVEEEGLFSLECSNADYMEFFRAVGEELAYRGFRPEETSIRALAARLGVTNIA